MGNLVLVMHDTELVGENFVREICVGLVTCSHLAEVDHHVNFDTVMVQVHACICSPVGAKAVACSLRSIVRELGLQTNDLIFHLLCRANKGCVHSLGHVT